MISEEYDAMAMHDRLSTTMHERVTASGADMFSIILFPNTCT